MRFRGVRLIEVFQIIQMHFLAIFDRLLVELLWIEVQLLAVKDFNGSL